MVFVDGYQKGCWGVSCCALYSGRVQPAIHRRARGTKRASYVQHRGKPGFLRVINPTSLAFPDYKVNRQLLSTGNLAVTDRVTVFLMDCPQYITPRYTAAEVEIAVAPLKQRIAELEAELKNGR